MNLQEIRELTTQQQRAVDNIILTHLYSKVELIEEIGHYIINSGGKRLRPLVVILSALACGYQGETANKMAAIIEFIHTATLLHDDVVDESTLRRGNETANAVWGDHTSVLVGDFIYSRAFEMMVSLNNMTVMELMAKTTNTISEGEVLQLLNAQDPKTTEARYYEVITCKTAILFAAACQLGAIAAELDDSMQQALHDFGLNFGIAYQLVDDVLDYRSSAEEMGKNIGDDLSEGKPTLPLIYVINNGNDAQRTLIHDAIKNADASNIAAIQKALTETGAIEYTAKQAQHYGALAKDSVDCLAESSYKTALLSLVDFILERSY